MATLYSKVKVGGHPLHPMLVAFPVTFYTTTLIGFATYALTGNLFWWRIGLWSNVAGVVTALVAAIPGFADWAVGIPKQSPAKATGLKHMLLNLSALALFTVNLVAQRNNWAQEDVTVLGEGMGVISSSGAGALVVQAIIAPDPRLALLLSALGFVLTLSAGFIGWALVQTHHVGVLLTDEQQRLEPNGRRTPPRSIVQS
jgi:uncharacterized membrane protein